MKVKWHPWPRTFRGTILLVWILLQAGLLGLVAISANQATSSSLEDQLKNQTQQLAPLLNAALTAPIMQRDYASVISIASEIVGTGNIAKLSIADANQHIITTAENQPLLKQSGGDDTFEVNIPLAFGQQHLGQAIVWVSRQRLNETEQQIALRIFYIFALALVLFVVIAAYLSKTITTPISSLAAAVKNIGKGDVLFRSTGSRQDEIGDLESAFQNMSLEIKERIDDLNNLNADLENRVAARTLELKDAADKLSAQVDQLRLLAAVADNSRFGISIIDAADANHPIVYVNPAFTSITGYTKEEAIGHRCRVFSNGIHDEQAMKVIQHAIDSKTYCSVEFHDQRKNGERFWNRLALFPVLIDANSPRYFVIYQNDISDYVHANADRELLLQQIQENQKFESLGIMVAGLAHEINNPLGMALSASSHLLQASQHLTEMKDKLPLSDEWLDFVEDEKVALKIIEENLVRATALVNGFKEVAADKSTDHIKTILLRDYLFTIQQSLTPVLKSSKCKLSIDVDPAIKVHLNTGALGQVISNLVINATLHAFDDKMTDRAILIAVKMGTRTLDLSIADNGRGVSSDAVQKIFTPFYSTRRSSGGTGLGLYISKQTALNKLHADLYLDTQHTGGARFVLSLPLP